MNRIALALVVMLAAVLPCAGAATTLKTAKVTQVQNDVRLSEGIESVSLDLDPAPPQGGQPLGGKIRPAKVGDVVEGAKTLTTGRKSRAELLFNDQTVARLGANSVFSFKPGSRDIDLKSGFLLLHTPKGKGGAKISTPSASASVLGTTVMLGALPGGGMKIVVLEGTASITYNGVTQNISAGQLVFITPEQGMSPAITVSLQQLMGSSALVTSFSNKIGSENLIADAIADQADLIAEGELEVSGVNIAGDPSLTVINQSALEALLRRLELVSAALGTLTADIDEDLTGVFPITPVTEGNLGIPNLINPDSAPLVGEAGEDGSIQFFGDRFFFSQGPPQIAGLGEGTTGVVFEASGESVNFVTSFNAIRFNEFVGGIESDGPLALIFTAYNGGVGVFNSAFEQNGLVQFKQGGIGAFAGNVEFSETSVLSHSPGINISSASGNILVDRSQFLLNALEAAEGLQIQFDAQGENATILLDTAVINTALGNHPGGVNIRTDGATGFVDVRDTQIIASTADLATSIDIVGNQVTLVNTTITGGLELIANIIDLTGLQFTGPSAFIGNEAGNALVNFHGIENHFNVPNGVGDVVINGVQTGSYTVSVIGSDTPPVQVGVPAP